jgi:hypothetical protein
VARARATIRPSVATGGPIPNPVPGLPGGPASP